MALLPRFDDPFANDAEFQASLLPAAPQRGGILAMLANPAVRQMLMGASQGFLEAGAPSLTPKGTGFGAALGAGIAGANKGYQSYEQMMADEAANRIKSIIEQRKADLEERRLAMEENKLNAPEKEGELVRNLRAAGIDPQSEEGQSIIRKYYERAGTGVNISLGGDGGPTNLEKRGEALGKVEADLYATAEADAAKGDELSVDASRLLDLAPKLAPGLPGLLAQYAGKGMDLLGFDVEQTKLDPKYYEEYKGIVAGLPSKMRSAGEGNMSDSDRASYEKVVGAIGQTVGANIAAAQALKALAERKQQKAELMSQWLEQGKSLIGFNRYWRQYLKENPIFPGGKVSDIKSRNGIK